MPDILVDAYTASGNDAYLTFAKDLIIAFAKMERKLWIDRGLIWNDHAVAERATVIIKFWRAYRNHNNFNPTEARLILQLLQRCILLLAKPSHFNSVTNHGIMQNLALLQYSIAFPFADDVE